MKDTDQKETVEQLLRRLEEKRTVIDGISDALMVLDTETFEILEVNRAFLDSYGKCREEVLGNRCHEVTHRLPVPCNRVDSRCPCPLTESVESGGPAHVEHAHRGREGETRYFEATAYPLKEANGQVTRIIHLSRDITRRKELELELREKEKLSGILELAGGASHEINQPLTVIISGLEQLVKRLSGESLEGDIARTILEHALRLEEISKKLGNITRYASKEYVSGKRIFDLDQGGPRGPDSGS